MTADVTDAPATPAVWIRAQNAAISINARIDAPVARKDGWHAIATRTEQTDANDPGRTRVARFDGKGATPDAALLDLVEKLPNLIDEPRTSQGHCPTCTCG